MRLGRRPDLPDRYRRSRYPLGRIEGRRTLRADISNVELLDGEFPLNLSLSDRSTGRIFDWREGSDSFEVANPTKATGLVAFDVTVKEQ